MSIDGFDPHDRDAFAAFSWRTTETVCTFLGAVGRVLGVETSGMENLPKGRALLVANHAFGFDVAFPAAAITRATGRVVYSLGEHAWWKAPWIRRFATSVGIVDGTQENADKLLSTDQLLLVMPGGLREAMKPSELRYRLLWGHRYGFVRSAIRNGAPVVPLACVGADEWFHLVGNPFERGRKWLGRAFPIPKPWGGLPILHPVKPRYAIGQPLVLQARPDQENDIEVVKRCRFQIQGALQELIDIELAKREGFEPDGLEP